MPLFRDWTVFAVKHDHMIVRKEMLRSIHSRVFDILKINQKNMTNPLLC